MKNKIKKYIFLIAKHFNKKKSYFNVEFYSNLYDFYLSIFQISIFNIRNILHLTLHDSNIISPALCDNRDNCFTV